MQSERQQVRRIVEGDREAYARFVDEYGPRVQRLVRATVRREADGEDLVQEIFLDLYRSLPRFRGESSLATWVYRVALNHCGKHRERRGPDTIAYDEARHERADASAGPARCAVQRELADQVRGALAGLTDPHRDVVVLHALHGLTYAECAEILGVPIGTVKSRLSHAFRRLRESLGGYVLSEGS